MSSFRSNSKASYLPRQQPRDKLHSDPDHGSYKLTLTSNEDSINHHSDVFPEEIIATPTKCNLPDVLPPGVKYSLYSNNNNNNNNNNSSSNGKMGKQLPPPKTVPHSAPIISANSLKSMFNFTPQQPQQNQVTPPSASSPVTPPPAYSTVAGGASSQPGSPTNHQQQQAISPKYTSQSTFDLKKTQILDSKYLSQSPAQIGLPPIPPLPTAPNESINNTNYLNQHHSASNSCSTNSNQQTVNNCNEFSEKADNLELSTAANTSTSTVEPAESNYHHTTQPQQQQSSPPPYSELDDSSVVVAPKEEEDRPTSSSSSTSTSAEANQHQHQQSETTCSIGVDSTVTTPVLECVTKEITLDERPSSPPKLQRTEIVLRVAAPTTEASSQTDDDLEAVASTSPSPRSPRSPPATLSLGISELVLDQGNVTRHSVATSTPGSPTGSPRSPPSTPTANCGAKNFFSKACTAAPRKVHPEEIDCDKLSHDLILQLSPSDKLHTILGE